MAVLKVPVTSADHIQGNEDAPVTLVEYGDYQCPFCGRAYAVIKNLQDHFGEQLRFVFRNFPLKEIHPHAEAAAEAAEFAGANGRFWEMHDGIYENQAELSAPMLLELAEALGLSQPNLSRAMEAREFAPRIRADFNGGVRSGVNGTPSLFVNGQRFDEAVELESLIAAVEAAMSPA